MRTAAKVLNIISLVCFGIVAILLLWIGVFGGTIVSDPAQSSQLASLTMGFMLVLEFAYVAAGVFVAYMSIKKINNEDTTKKDFILWGVLNILFVSPISGVLTLLCMLDASD